MSLITLYVIIAHQLLRPTVLTPSGTQAGIPLHFVQPYCRRVKADWLGYILFADYLERIAHGTYGLVKLFYNGPNYICMAICVNCSNETQEIRFHIRVPRAM